MYPDTHSRLLAARSALVLGPLLAAVSVVFQPDLGGTTRQMLAALADSPLATVSAVAFLVSQLPLLVSILAIGRLVEIRAPRLSTWGTALGVLGCFGHTVFGGTSLIYVMMANDEKHRDVYADLMTRIQSSPVMLFSMVGLLGTVLGMLFLGIGLFRTRTGPVWVGPAIWAFLVVEFVGSSISRYASYLSVMLLGAAFIALAALLDRTSEAEREQGAPTPQLLTDDRAQA